MSKYTKNNRIIYVLKRNGYKNCEHAYTFQGRNAINYSTFIYEKHILLKYFASRNDTCILFLVKTCQHDCLSGTVF